MQIKKTTFVVLAMMVASVALTFVPTAAAQNSLAVTMVLPPPTESVKPLQSPINFVGTTTISGSQDLAGTNVIGFTLAYTVAKQPSWASVTVSPTSDIITIAPGATPSFSQSKSFTVTVTATQDAPAFQPDTIDISVTVTPSQGTGGPGAKTAKASAPVQASFFSILDVQLSEAIKVERPQTPVVFPLKVTNFGNANTKVTFDVTDKTENLNTPVPIPVTLQSKQAGGNLISSDVPLTVQTPYKNGYLNEVGVVTYKITSAYALDSKLKGDETVVSVVVTTKGFYVPGVEIPLVIGLIGLAAVLLRRRA